MKGGLRGPANTRIQEQISAAVVAHEHLGAAYHAMVSCHGGALLSAKSEAPDPFLLRSRKL